MTLVRFDKVSLEFGDNPLLINADLTIDSGERVCLIGRNGAGKTSLLRLITGAVHPDHGEIECKTDLRVSQLDQNLPEVLDSTVREVVSHGLARVKAWVDEYERKSAETLDARGLRELQDLQHKIESAEGWHLEQRIDTILTELELPAERKLTELSGGWRRRVALAKALVGKPELLLLDEPTNHLDLATIEWLEHIVFSYPGSVVFVTHDRAFLQKLATRIIEIDRGKLISWPGNYQNYLRRKEKALEDEAQANRLFDKRMGQEEVWIRQGIKARRTRNEGRVRALMAMRAERAQRIDRPHGARINIEEGERSGRKVIRLRNVTHSFDDKPLIRNLSLNIMRGDRIGLVGNNGVGKSTLLNILLGTITPQQGTVKHGTNLEIGYFDQLRQQLELDRSVADNIGGGKDYIRINGKDRHVIGYLKGFLFSPKRARTPVRALSGGERNRIILAKLFARPTNLLVLDEPTNDLDIETLDVLEQRLVEYQGTLIVVSHDREFLDNVVTSIFVFEPSGSIREYVGGYSDWIRRGRELADIENPNQTTQSRRSKTATDGRRSEPQKLSYKQQRELEKLPKRIDACEAATDALQVQIAAPNFYGQPHEHVQETLDELGKSNTKLENLIARWTELEEMQERFLRARDQNK
ncbi:MAG: ATP-binding cassette domain-containing protein [Gammaproteobacteria bacterium]|nr:MAG: ATP-binding cassette domain-containing protein [Gammaproteobacteria bacterium]